MQEQNTNNQNLLRWSLKLKSLGAWNAFCDDQNLLRWSLKQGYIATAPIIPSILEFTPLEFETLTAGAIQSESVRLEFTPLEFETMVGWSITLVVG